VLYKIGVKNGVAKKGGGMMTKREKFYVWEHVNVGHVWWLEFCPECVKGGSGG
jgi:hypothetical protein